MYLNFINKSKYSLYKVMYFTKPLLLKSGNKINNYKIIYETYGNLNKKKNNAILILHALNASHHLCGNYKINLNNYGWWNNIVGNNKCININNFFILCISNIGTCYGSTNHTHINYNNNNIYSYNFPLITIDDWINSQVLLFNRLKIKKFLFIIGSSLGGAQVLLLSNIYPNFFKNYIIIASTIKLSSKNLALNKIIKNSILFDNNYFNGNYYYNNNFPKFGLILSRIIGHISYISNISINKKFGRNFKLGYNKYKYNNNNFQIDSYLDYQAKKFSNYFDANSYFLINTILNYINFNKFYYNNNFIKNINIKSKFLILSFNTDCRFNLKSNFNIYKAYLNNNLNIIYYNINSLYGHDEFLLENNLYIKLINNYLKKEWKKIKFLI